MKERTTETRLRAREAVSLIASREIRTRVRAKSFLLSNIVLIAVVVGGISVWSILGSGSDDTQRVGLVGVDQVVSQAISDEAGASGARIEMVQIPDEPSARTATASGDLALALVLRSDGDGYTAYTPDTVDTALETVVRGAVATRAVTEVLAERNIDFSQISSEAAADSALAVVPANPPEPYRDQRIAVAMVGVIVLLMSIMLGGTMVAAGVVEEKSSRIVELLLAAVRPLHLLWGKILGIGLVAFFEVMVLGVLATVTASLTGLLDVPSVAISMMLASVAWFLLGYLFFSTLYAATGAMVSRQEELGAASMPLAILSMATLYVAIFGINSLDSGFVRVMSWIPPFSASLMPIRIATGDTDAVQIIGTFVIMIGACLGVSWIAARVYQRSILKTGARVTWSEALRSKHSEATSVAAVQPDPTR
ncbi:ABC transporter permease [Rhodococcus sp. IEGM 1381]|uniref:ABC transporter permease n=1 Tax=Rhodococcus sp. IEGM 1381 TaxID=3047085 RepID=UPI0024B6A3E2|nr:ABC transporter permease [Rhodococcus sp. IEGM 1381]MDI9894858.1 ABC transporter permease [Rhodococcus sp. IEGM 1381]